MQHIKDTEKISLIKEVAHTDVILTDSLAKVVDKFDLERNFSVFNTLKDNGYTISSLLKECVIMPFLKSATVYALLKHGVSGSISAKKDAYYTAKNNEHIDWRSLLYKVSKRFKYLVSNDIPTEEKRVTAIIFDDTLLEITGKFIEKVSLTFDHVSKRYQLGFKLLVCAFWDGVSFIPLDFTLHREKGTKQEEIINQYHRTTKALESTEGLLRKAQKQLDVYQKKQTIAQLMVHTNSNILNNKLLNNTNLNIKG